MITDKPDFSKQFNQIDNFFPFPNLRKVGGPTKVTVVSVLNVEGGGSCGGVVMTFNCWS